MTFTYIYSMRMDNIGAQAAYWVYIMTNTNNTVLYTGVTSDLINRCHEHRAKKHPTSFSAKYNANKLVWYQKFNDIDLAIAREKQIKAGSRKNKIELIESVNAEWLDLFETKLNAENI
jgi:putative endonuclease